MFESKKNMKCLFFILFIVSLASVQTQNCHMLKDGKYRVEYDSVFKNYPKYSFF
jgi:hypothetical protein